MKIGQCGSCWTFGTAEVIESYYALATGQLPTLSEQQILDCVPNPDQCGGTGGCGGGTPELAFEKLIEIGMC
jgi:cathepsin L